MQCLKDSVSPFYGCGAPNPISGMYLSNLPGIEFANIDGIANSDQITWLGVWNDLQATAIDTFREEIIEEFGKKYQLRQITQTVDLGKLILPIQNIPYVPSTPNGILLETMLSDNNCIGSNMMGIYVQEVNFYWTGSNPNPSFTVMFQDADTLAIEKTIVVNTAVPGWNNVFVDFNFAARRLQTLVTGNFDNYVGLDISNFALDSFGSSTWGFSATSSWNYLYFSWSGCGIQSRVNGITYNSTSQTTTRSMNTAGISIVFSTKCSWDAVVCANKRHFFSCWQHCLAIELLNYRINSSRINRWTSINSAQARDLQELFTLKYRGGKGEGASYPGKLKLAVESLVLNDVDGCIKMNDYAMYTEARL